MHELSIAQEIIEILKEYLPSDNAVAVKSIKISIGKLSNICVDSLRFCYKLLTENTFLKNSELFIQMVPVRIKCKNCDTVYEVNGEFFYCINCGSSNTEFLTGYELNIDEIEIEDESELKR